MNCGCGSGGLAATSSGPGFGRWFLTPLSDTGTDLLPSQHLPTFKLPEICLVRFGNFNLVAQASHVMSDNNQLAQLSLRACLDKVECPCRLLSQLTPGIGCPFKSQGGELVRNIRQANVGCWQLIHHHLGMKRHDATCEEGILNGFLVICKLASVFKKREEGIAIDRDVSGQKVILNCFTVVAL
ncbi:hypothetical protein K440DRAFT_642049 [Wilcoxina mikolae CBS 423.85]|nr:hypothetical protein K440DRAFT_642049 [Wilcoxina mikolae CBS 423.85]